MKLDINIILESDRLTLKPLCKVSDEIDDEYIASIANDYDIAKYVGHRFPNPYTIDSAKGFKEYAKNSWEKESEYIFAIFEKENNLYIGNIGVSLDKENNIVGNLGYWLGKKFEGKGHMSEATKLLIDFSFDILKVRKIEAGVYDDNIGSQKVLQKNGFKIEGIKRESHMFRTGEVLDNIIFGLLLEERSKFNK
jgi:ribosomal-protein-alanine N-acetyltransferase